MALGLRRGTLGAWRSCKDAFAEFLSAYYEALKKFLRGMRDVVFPPGTYKMRVEYGVRCADPPLE